MRFGTLASVLTMLCASPFCVSQTGAQIATDVATMRIQILSGRTGRPLANQKIVLTGKDGSPSHGVKTIGTEMTDGEGYAVIPNVDASLPNVSVLVEGYQPCSRTNMRAFSLGKVRAAGVVSENSCRPRITIYPQQGTLVFFVRPETFIEKMRR